MYCCSMHVFATHNGQNVMTKPAPKCHKNCFNHCIASLIARFIGPPWGPSRADRTQVGPMLTPGTLLSGMMFVIHGLGSYVTTTLSCFGARLYLVASRLWCYVFPTSHQAKYRYFIFMETAFKDEVMKETIIIFFSKSNKMIAIIFWYTCIVLLYSPQAYVGFD